MPPKADAGEIKYGEHSERLFVLVASAILGPLALPGGAFGLELLLEYSWNWHRWTGHRISDAALPPWNGKNAHERSALLVLPPYFFNLSPIRVSSLF